MTSETLDYLETGASPHRHTLVWLHGLGADGYDLQPFAQSLALSGLEGIRHVFPHAPYRKLDLYGQNPIRAWYRFDERGFGRGEVVDDIVSAKTLIESLLLSERKDLPSQGQLILGGFSQGGVMALTTGLAGRIQLDGIVSLSAYCLESIMPATTQPPVFMAHGISDPIIPLATGYRSSRWLKQYGIPLEWHEYPIGHAICSDEIDDLSHWLRKRLT